MNLKVLPVVETDAMLDDLSSWTTDSEVDIVALISVHKADWITEVEWVTASLAGVSAVLGSVNYFH